MFAALVLGAAGPAFADGEGIYPTVPFRTGSQRIEFGIEGPAARNITIDVEGPPGAGEQDRFIWRQNVVVPRNAAGIHPYLVILPLIRPWPADQPVRVVVHDGATTFSQEFDPRAPLPALTAAPLQVRRGDAQILAEARWSGPGLVSTAELHLAGLSAVGLRASGGDPERAGRGVFARPGSVRLFPALQDPARPQSVTFAIPVDPEAIAEPGVIIADLTLTDPFGRSVRTSTVAFTQTGEFDALTALNVAPSPLAMIFGQRLPLHVTGTLERSGEIDLSGSRLGTTYTVTGEGDPLPVAVDMDGVVTGVEAGRATVHVRNGNQHVAVPVTVAGVVQLGPNQFTVLPADPHLAGVGASLPLHLLARLQLDANTPCPVELDAQDACLVDVSSPQQGTTWRSESPGIVSVDMYGSVRAQSLGFARISALRGGAEVAWTQVRVDDGQPRVTLSVPSAVVAGEAFDAQARATDDLSVAGVDFLLNGVVVGRLESAPYVLRLQAPPVPGQRFRVAARAVDGGGQFSAQDEVEIQVTAPPPQSDRHLVYEGPVAGATLVSGARYSLRATSGDWRAEALTAGDFREVRYFVDDVPVGSTADPRHEMRTLPGGDLVPVPIWAVPYTPGPALAGGNIVVRAVGIDAYGREVRGEALLLHVVGDRAPGVAWLSPHSDNPQNAVAVTAGRSVEIRGRVADDTLALGSEVSLAVDDVIISSRTVTTPAVEGSLAGEEPVEFEWVPPPYDETRPTATLRLRVQDRAGAYDSVEQLVAIVEDAPPAVALDAPAVVAAGGILVVGATVMDDGATPPTVAWRVDGRPFSLQQIPPYGVRIPVPQVPGDGAIEIDADVTDSAGHLVTAHRVVSIEVDVAPPSATIVSPRPGARAIRTVDLPVVVQATDVLSTVDEMEVIVRGGGGAPLVFPLMPTPGPGPRTFSATAVVPSAQFPAGNALRLSVRATDHARNVGVGQEVEVQLVADGPPTVHVNSPVAGTQLLEGAPFDVFVHADDDVGVQSVTVSCPEVPPDDCIADPVIGQPGRFRIRSAPRPPDGVLLVLAEAQDGAGHVASDSVEVRVVADDEPPSVAFVRPGAGQRVVVGQPFNVQVTAHDSAGLQSARLDIGNLRLQPAAAADAGLATVYGFTWTPEDLGPATLVAHVTDNSGLVADSSVSVVVVADRAPRVSIVEPAPGAAYRAGAAVRLRVLAEDDVSAPTVRLSDGVACNGAEFPPPQGATWLGEGYAPVAAGPDGSAWVAVCAVDSAGQSTIARISLTLLPDPERPRLSIGSPSAGADGTVHCTRGDAIAVVLDASDDTRVAALEAVVVGVLPPADAVDLGPPTSRYEETRIPNPLAPGEVITARRHVVRRSGWLRLPENAAPSTYTLRATATDPSGHTETVDLALVAAAPVDAAPPALELSVAPLLTPNLCPAGAHVTVTAEASDPHLIGLTLLGEGIQEQVLAAEHSARIEIALDVPDEAGGEPIELFAEAPDSAGNVSRASYACEVVEDTAPAVALRAPAPGAALVAGHVYTPPALDVRFDDDVGIVAWSDFLGSDPGARLAAAPAQATIDGLRMTFRDGSGLQIAIDADGIATATPFPEAPEAAGPDLALSTLRGVAVDVEVLIEHAGIGQPSGLNLPGNGSGMSLALGSEEAQGTTVVTVEAPGLLPEEKPPTVVLTYVDAEVTEVYFTSSAGSQFLWRRHAVEPRPGETAASLGFVVPLAWGDAALSGTMAVAAFDTRGHGASAEVAVDFSSDEAGPRISMFTPSIGAEVIAGRPADLRVHTADDLTVRAASFAADGHVVDLVPEGAQATIWAGTFTPRAALIGQVITARVVATDARGNQSSLDVPLRIVADAPPRITLTGLETRKDGLATPLQVVSRFELATGHVRLLQGQPATLSFQVADDIGVAGVTADYEGVQENLPGLGTYNFVFTPPVAADGAPTVLTLTATDAPADAAPHTTESRLVVETLRSAPAVVALSSPRPGTTLTEGSRRLVVGAVADDDIRVDRVRFEIDGTLVAEIQRGAPIPNLGPAVALNPEVRAAVAELPPPYDDATRALHYAQAVELPRGFVQAGARALTLRATAFDVEGNATAVEQSLTVSSDESAPVVEIETPTFNQDVVENTPLQIRVRSHDDVEVASVEVFAGQDPAALVPIHFATGFDRQDMRFADFEVFAPLVEAEHQLPYLSNDLGREPYFIGARAQDVNGNLGELTIMPMDIVRDREPSAAIIAPDDGAPAVAGAPMAVLVAADDDVAVTNVRLLAVPIRGNEEHPPLDLPTLGAPPFVFEVTVPIDADELRIQAFVVDTYGHPVESQEIILPVVEDLPPVVELGYPRNGTVLTEGRDVLVRLAAHDDVEIRTVELEVTGGLTGPLTLVSSVEPYSFLVPVPPGSAGHDLVFRASARDSAGLVGRAPAALVHVAVDDQDPTVSLFTPVDHATAIVGTRIEVEAIAEDDVSVRAVRFSVDDGAPTIVGAPPYRFTYRVTANPVNAASHVITATAIDGSGNDATATTHLVAVADAPPARSDLIAPGGLVEGRPALFGVTHVEDDVGVVQVDLLARLAPPLPAVPGPWLLAGRRFIQPYTFTYIPAPGTVGQDFEFKAVVRDTAGLTADSVQTTKLRVVADAPPSVAFVQPLPPPAANTAVAGHLVALKARAVDREDDLRAVIFLANGLQVDAAFAPETVPGEGLLWTGSFRAPTDAAEVRLNAVALDRAGHEVVSEPVVLAIEPDLSAPQVEITEPVSHDVVTVAEHVRLVASARDNAGLREVSFSADGVFVEVAPAGNANLTGTDNFAVDWPAPGPAGAEPALAHVLRARAVDLSGNVALSHLVPVEPGVKPVRYVPPPLRDGWTHLAAHGQDVLITSQRGVVGRFAGQETEIAAMRPDGSGLKLDFAPSALAWTGDDRAVVVQPEQRRIDGVVEPAMLHVLDATRGHAALQGAIELRGSNVLGLAVLDNLVFLAMGAGGVEVIDLGADDEEVMPMRLDTIRTIGMEARDVAVHGTTLLIAVGGGGLRTHDLTDVHFGEVPGTLLALPGSADRLVVTGDRAYVGCGNADADIAVVDLADPLHPRFEALLPQTIARPDASTEGVVSLTARGNMAVASLALFDQDERPIKGLAGFSTFGHRDEGGVVAHANLPSAVPLAAFGGGIAAVMGGAIGVFDAPRFDVEELRPADGDLAARLTPPDGPGQPIASVVFSRSVSEASLAPAAPLPPRLRLLEGDPFLGVPVDVDLVTNGARVDLSFRPGVTSLLPSTRYFLVVDAEVSSNEPTQLGRRFVASFTTRSSDSEAPVVRDVSPPGGSVDGGTHVTVHGADFQPGARLLLGGVEANVENVAGDGMSLTATTAGHAPGPVLVTVRNPDGNEGHRIAGYLYSAELFVQAVLPASGALEGGEVVQITGSGFARGVIAYFDGVAAPSTQVVSTGLLQVTTPPHAFGPVDVAVADASGRTSIARNAFVYTRLRPTARVGRFVPEVAQPDIRPADKLPIGTPGAVALVDGYAWLLSHASMFPSAANLDDFYARSTYGAVSAVDVRDPAAPALVGGLTLDLPLDPQDLAFRRGAGPGDHDRLYVVTRRPNVGQLEVPGAGSASLVVIDASRRENPQVRTVVPLLGGWADVAEPPGPKLALGEGFLLVATGEAGLLTYVLNDPDAPVLVAQRRGFPVAGQVQDLSVNEVALVGRHAYVTTGEGANVRNFVLDLGGRQNPLLTAWSPAGHDLSPFFTRAIAGKGSQLLLAGDLPLGNRPRPLDLLVPQTVNGTALSHSFGLALSGGLIQVLATGDPQHPEAIDATSAWPATELADVAAEGATAVVSVSAAESNGNEHAADALVVLRLPFTVVSAVDPPPGTGDLPASVQPTITFVGDVVGAGNTFAGQVGCVLLNGSALGVDDHCVANVPVGAGLPRIRIAPQVGPWSVGRHRIRITGAGLPTAFETDFEVTPVQGTPPQISSVSPTEGPVAGGNLVTLAGAGFQANSIVRFGSGFAQVMAVAGDGTTLQVRVPRQDPGLVPIEVVNPTGGRALRVAGYVYQAQLALAVVAPDHGPASGGTRVLVTGAGFSPGTQVFFDGAPGARTRVLGLNAIETYTPNGEVGPANVEVRSRGATVTRINGFTYEAPAQGAVGLNDRVYDIATVGDLALLAAGDDGLRIIDVSGIYRRGPLAGLYIPPDRRGRAIDEDGDLVDDRLVGSLAFDLPAVSISYPPDGEGGDRLFVGLGSPEDEGGGGVAEVDLSNPETPGLVAVAGTRKPVHATDARGKRLFAAAGAPGLLAYDIDHHPPFWVDRSAMSAGALAQTLGVGRARAAIGTGARDEHFVVTGGSLRVYEILGHPVPAQLAGVDFVVPNLDAQRVRMWRNKALVAAGDRGLVVVDLEDATIAALDHDDAAGGGPWFAWDVQVEGDLAYVALGERGVAVVDLTNLSVARYVEGLTGPALTVDVMNGRVVSGHGEGSASTFEYDDGGSFAVVGASVAEGDVVPVDLPSITVRVSTALNPATAAAAFSLERIPLVGAPVPVAGVLEAGSAGHLRSTLQFRPGAGGLPADSTLRLTLTKALRSVADEPLLVPLALEFRTGTANSRLAGAPHVDSIAPRTGLAGPDHPQVATIAGDGFSPTCEVSIGGLPAETETHQVEGRTVLRVDVPAAPAGLADVTVFDPATGLSDTLVGGYLYFDPPRIDDARPRFFNPRGNSGLTLTGVGFMPAWAAGAQGTEIFVRGVGARNVTVLSAFEVRASVLPGTFGPANVSVRVASASDEHPQADSPIVHGYGLPYLGEEHAAAIRPTALAADPHQANQIYAAAGPTGAGNQFLQLVVGHLAPSTDAVGAYRVASFDVTPPHLPIASSSVAASLDSDEARGAYDLLNLVEQRLAAGGAPPDDQAADFALRQALLDELELGPDAMDVAFVGGQMLLANGESGLSVLGVAAGGAPQLLGRERGNTGLARRLLPTSTGALVVADTVSHLVPCEDGEALDAPPFYRSTSAGTDGGGIGFYDVRAPADPFVVRTPPWSGGGRPLVEMDFAPVPGPSAAAVSADRLFVVETPRTALEYCPTRKLVQLPDGRTIGREARPPPPTYSLGSSGDAAHSEIFVRESRLHLLPRDGSGPDQRLDLYSTLSDVLVLGDTLVLGVADAQPEAGAQQGQSVDLFADGPGVYFFELAALPAVVGPLTPAAVLGPALRGSVPFTDALANQPGKPVRMRADGQLLFVSAEEGGVVILDASDPTDPQVLSAGNEEVALDQLPMDNRLMVASGEGITALSLPFLYVSSTDLPADGALAGGAQFITLEFNRPLTVNDEVNPWGNPGTVTFDPPLADGASLLVGQGDARHLVVQAELDANTVYTMTVSGFTGEADHGQIRPFVAHLRTAALDVPVPHVTGISPWRLVREAGATFTVEGDNLGQDTAVRLGNLECSVLGVIDGNLHVALPAGAPAGAADLTVSNGPAGQTLSDRLPDGLVVLDPATNASVVQVTPDHGAPAGGTRVTLHAESSLFAPGVEVLLDGVAGEHVDVVDLHTVKFTTPHAPNGEPAIVDVQIRQPGGLAVAIGQFSFDMPSELRLNLPGFPPREASDIAVQGNLLYVGVPTAGYEGLDIIDLLRPEYPIRLSEMRTERPVRGVAVAPGGALTLLAVESDGLLVTNTDDPARPFVSGTLPPPVLGEWAMAVRLSGDLAFTGWATPGAPPAALRGHVRIYEASSGALALHGEALDLDTDVLALGVDLEHIAALTGNLPEPAGQVAAPSLRVFSRAGAPIRTIALPGGGAEVDEALRGKVALFGDLVYVTWRQRLYVYEISTGHLVMSRSMGAAVSGLDVVDGLAYVATASDVNGVVTVPSPRLVVTGTTPADQSLAPVDAAIQIRFSRGAAVMVGATTRRVYAEGETPDEIVGTWSTGDGGRLARFEPTDPFDVGQVIHVELGNVAALGAPALPHLDVDFSFTTVGQAAPFIDRVVPGSGHVTNDSTFAVCVVGRGLGPNTAVSIGGALAEVAAPAGPCEGVWRTLPVHAPGAVAVVARNETDASDRLEAVRLGGFVYRAGLSIAGSPDPDRAPQQGGIEATITGTGFAPDAQVLFGGAPANAVRVERPGRIRVRVPPGPPGPVDVVVRQHNGPLWDTVTLANGFTYGAGLGASYRPNGLPEDVRVEGTIAYIAHASGIDVVDIGEPNAPRAFLRDLGGDGHPAAHRLVRSGNVLIAAMDDALIGLDTHFPGEPVEIWRLDGGPVTDVAISGDLVAAVVAGEVRLYRLGEVEHPLRIAFAPAGLPTVAQRVAFAGPRLLIAGDGHLYGFDVTDGHFTPVAGSPKDLGVPAGTAMPADTAMPDLVAADARILVAAGDQLVVVDSFQAPARGLLLPPLPGGARPPALRIRTAGDVAYVAAGPADVMVIDLADLTPISTIPAFGEARCLAFRGERVFVGTRFYMDPTLVTAEARPAGQAGAAWVEEPGFESAVSDRLRVDAMAPDADSGLWPVLPVEVLFSHTLAAGALGHIELARAGQVVQATFQVQAELEGTRVRIRQAVPEPALDRETHYTLTVGRQIAGVGAVATGAAASVEFDTGAEIAEVLPSIERVSPPAGPLNGAPLELTLTGRHLDAVTEVRLGTEVLACVPPAAGDDEVRRCTLPGPAAVGRVAGPAALHVTTEGGLTAERLGAYRFVGATVVTSVSPAAAPFDSRTEVRVSGQGLYSGTSLVFGDRPARSVRLDDDGSLLAEVPDGVIGDVTLRAEGAPLEDGIAFTFTLPSAGSYVHGAGAAIGHGDWIVSAETHRLSFVDLTTADSPSVSTLPAAAPQPEDAVASPRDVVVVDGSLYVVGQDDLVAYDLPDPLAFDGAGTPMERARSTFAPHSPGGFGLAAPSADGWSLAVADGTRLVFLAEDGDTFGTVDELDMGDTVLAVRRAGSDLAVLLAGDGGLYVGDFAPGGPSEETFFESPGLPTALATDGERIAVAGTGGLLIVEPARDPAGRRVPIATGATQLVLDGPLLYARLANRVEVYDLTSADSPRRLSYAPCDGSGPLVVAGGVVAVSDGATWRFYDQPFPNGTELAPRPGLDVPSDGFLRLTVADRLDLLPVLSTTRVTLDDDELQSEGFGRDLIFPLPPGVSPGSHEVVWTFPEVPFSGGTLDAPWPMRIFVTPPEDDDSMAVTSITPRRVSVGQEVDVQVQGRHLDDVVAATLGDDEVTVRVLGEGSLVLELAGPEAPGSLDLRLFTEPLLGEPEAALVVPRALLVTPVLTVTAVAPAEVDERGEVVAVTGTAFAPDLIVRETLGGPALPLTQLSPTHVNVQVPPGPRGAFALRFSRPGLATVIFDALERVDEGSPGLVGRIPQAGAAGVARAAPIFFAFDEALDSATLEVRCPAAAAVAAEGEVRILDANDAPPPAPLAPAPGRIVRFTQNPALPAYTSCVATVHAVDPAGNQSEFTTSFVTVDDVDPVFVGLSLDGEAQALEGSISASRRLLHLLEVTATDNSGQTPVVTVAMTGEAARHPAPSNDFDLTWPNGVPAGGTDILLLTATDAAGRQATAHFTIDVQNVAPEVTATWPDWVYQDTGGSVCLVGSNLGPDLRVEIGHAQEWGAVALEVSGGLCFDVPPGPGGPVDLRYAAPGDPWVVLPSAIDRTLPPIEIEGVEPQPLGIAGGWVTVAGRGFVAGTTAIVRKPSAPLDDVPAQVQPIDGSLLRVLVPASTVGNGTLQLWRPGDQVAVADLEWRDRRPPQVVHVSPATACIPTAAATLEVTFDEALTAPAPAGADASFVCAGILQPWTAQGTLGSDTLTFGYGALVAGATCSLVVGGYTDVEGNLMALFQEFFEVADDCGGGGDADGDGYSDAEEDADPDAEPDDRYSVPRGPDPASVVLIASFERGAVLGPGGVPLPLSEGAALVVAPPAILFNAGQGGVLEGPPADLTIGPTIVAAAPAVLYNGAQMGGVGVPLSSGPTTVTAPNYSVEQTLYPVPDGAPQPLLCPMFSVSVPE